MVTHIAMLNRSTPLMAAARRGDAKAVRMLLEAGADRRVRNAIGLDALAVSRAFGPFPDVEAVLSGEAAVAAPMIELSVLGDDVPRCRTCAPEGSSVVAT